jgi:hypothetical protein
MKRYEVGDESLNRRGERAAYTRGRPKLTSLFTASRTSHGSPSSAAIAFAAALAIAPMSALAEAQVRGSPEAVTVEAQNASVEDILSALSAAFGMHYRSSANLERRLNGTYEGSLKRGVARILEGYNFFVKADEAIIEVTVLGTGNTRVGTGASFGYKVAERPADAAPAVQPSPEIKVAQRPVPSAPSTAPSPEIKAAEGQSPPAPSLTSPVKGPAPAPVPELGQAGAPSPSPAPPAPGSTPASAPRPGLAAAQPSTPAPSVPGSAPTPVQGSGPSAILPPAAAAAPPLASPRGQ